MIALDEIYKVFNRGQRNEFTAVAGVSLRVDRGALVVLKGPSGSGKTTLLSLIGCMGRPTAGRIRMQLSGLAWLADPAGEQEVDVSGLPERFLTDIRRHTFGFVFQQFNLIRGVSARDNVMAPLAPVGVRREAMLHAADQLLARFDLGNRAHERVELLSGGELQRVAIARALINDPHVIIADEPTAHLDSRLSTEFMAIIAALRSEGKTVVIASHDPLVYESPHIDTVLEMRDGRLVSAGERS
jgi:putative ABC transport system ATP-binding protein